jgi:hypothetical protein
MALELLMWLQSNNYQQQSKKEQQKAGNSWPAQLAHHEKPSQKKNDRE